MSGQPFLLGHICQEGFGQLRRGIRPQILQSLKKCDIYEKIISEKSIKEPLEYQKEQKFVEDKMYGGTVL